MPISRRYMRTGSLVLSSAPGVRSSSSSSAPSPVRSSSFSSAVLLLGVDDLDAGAAERAEQVVELVGRGDVGRQQFVDLVVQQVALLLADGDELPHLVVFFFDRQRCSPLPASALLPLPDAMVTSPFPDSLLRFVVSGQSASFPARRSVHRGSERPVPAAGRFALHRGALAVEAMLFESSSTQSDASPAGAAGWRQSLDQLRPPLYLDAPSASGGKDSAGHRCRDRACRRMSRVASPSDRRRRAPPGGRAACPDRASAPKSGPRSAGFDLPERGTRRSASSTLVCRWTAAFRISARTTSSVIRALWASRSANWSRAAASGIRAATVSICAKNCRRLSSFDRSCPADAAIEQVFEIRPRIAQPLLVRRRPLLRMKVSGSSPVGSMATLTSNPSATSSSRRSRRRALAGGVGVEAEDDFRGEPAQQLRLRRRQRRAATRRPRGDPGLIHLREVEIALDQDGVLQPGGSRALLRFRP